MTQREQVRRLLNGAMFPYTTAEVAAVLNLPQPTIRRILGEVSGVSRWIGWTPRRFTVTAFHPFEHNMN
jgi:AraC-like DNA-binding protein